MLAAACITVVLSAAEPMIRKTTVVSLRLPRNYQPAIFPAHAFDEEIEVGVVLPEFDRDRTAIWTVPVSWIGEVDPDTHVESKALFEVDQVIVNAAEPVAAVIPGTFRLMFPRTTILRNAQCPTCALVFVVVAESRAVADSQNMLQRLQVMVSVNVLNGAGDTITTLSGEGLGPQAKRVSWSTESQTRGMGSPALKDAMDRLFAALSSDPPLSEFIQEKVAQRARPSDLETTVFFDDAASLIPNGRLDAGEQTRLRFTVRNSGVGPAFAVRLHFGATTAKIIRPSDVDLGDFLPQETKTIDVPLGAAIDIGTGQEQLQIDTIERRGFGGRPVLVELATQQVRAPTLEIADIRLEDRGGRTRADGNGRPSNGETLEAAILVRNSGPGDAAGVTLTMSSTQGVEFTEPLVSVGPIPVNEVREARALLRIPTAFDEADLSFTVRAVEVRGAAIAMTEKEQHWPLDVKMPHVEVAFRLFDGNSPRSTGNRDGVANNGETLEVALTTSNRGSMSAHGVRLELTSSIVGLGLTPTTVDVGDLPPFSEGMEHRIQVSIPRALTRGDSLQRLSMDVAISQADFPIGQELIGLPFNMQRPRLVATVAAQTPLLEGNPAMFMLDVRNDGPLAAEDVKVDVRSDDVGVELLDDLGKPMRSLRLDLGMISATTAARVQLKAYVRRNAPLAAGFLKVVVSQRDFESSDAQTPLMIQKEMPARISTVPATLPKRATSPSPVVPATISFQRFRDGNRFHDETLILSFEVQSQTPVELVRLQHNRRAVVLPDNAPVRSGETLLWQYDLPVQLEYGTNEFEVVVITAAGVPNSRTMTLFREKPRGRIWLAVVGISKYRDGSLVDLDFAQPDAVAVHALYRQLGIPSDQIIELLDENATLGNIKRSLGTELVRNAANPDDTVLIYFAGHGEREADRSSADSDGYSKYLLPHDTDPRDLFGTALSMEELSRIMQRLRAERVVLIIDSCFSGAAGGRTPFEPNAASRGVTTSEFLTRMADAGKGRVILAASDSDEVAQESTTMRHGIFTYFLLEGLRGDADIDKDGRVDVDEIYKFLSQKVGKATHGLQNPMRKSPNLTGTLVLGGRLQ
jgi:hypothetical protein